MFMGVKIAVDASALVENRTGVGNYIFQILMKLVSNQDNEFILYSNTDIFFPDYRNVKKIVHRPYMKGPLWQNTQLAFSLFRDKPDVFWGGNGYLPVITPKGTKLILTIHDLVYKYAGDTMPWLSRLSRKIFQPLSVQTADKIVAVSQSTNLEMAHHYNRKADQVVHPVIDRSYFERDISSKELIKNNYDIDNFLLTIGTLEPRKNMATLVRAYLSVIEQGYRLPLLAIVGGKGWMQGELDKLVEQGVRKGVIKKLGYVPDSDLPLLYSSADAFILASTYEGFGMPVLEAQVSGTPVIISNILSMKEAAGGICTTFEPTVESIAHILILLSKGELELVCRMVDDVNNTPSFAANTYIELIEKL